MAKSIIFAALVLLATHVTFSTVIDPTVRKGWKSLDSSKDIDDAFGDKMHSFGVQENWKICMSKAVFTVPHFSVIQDYTGIIASYLKQAGKADGGCVKLGRGTYHISSPIEIPSHTCIVGAGMEDTTVKLLDGTNAFAEKGMFYSRKGERVSLQGFTIDGNKEKQKRNEDDTHSGVYFELVNYAWFRNVRAKNMLHHGFDTNGSKDRWAAHLLFEGSVAADNRLDGFKIGQTNYASVSNCHSKNNGRHGVNVSRGSKKTLIKRNLFAGNGKTSKGCGCMIQKTDGLKPKSAVVEDTEITGANVAGICVNNAEDVKVKNVKVKESKKDDCYCFDLVKAKNFSEKDNKCEVKTIFSPRSAYDGTCSKGIPYKDVCCPSKCRVCGGSGCGTRSSGKVCCVGTIRSSKRSCDSSSPPCRLTS